MTAAYVPEACRLYVMVMLVAAALGKARAIGRFAETLELLIHIPARWSRAVAAAIAASELVIAIALICGGTLAHAGMVAALALFLAFTTALLVGLAQRREVSCSCFGFGDHPISAWDVVRNLLLISACATWLVDERSGAELAPSAWLALLGVALIGLALSTNLQPIAAGLRTTRGSSPAELAFTVPLGQVVPAFEGRVRADGRSVSSAQLAGQATVLLFLSGGCPKCRAVVTEVRRLLPAIDDAGVGLWIIPADSRHDLSPLLDGSALVDRAVVVERAARERLNPRRAAPFYIFLDHQMIALASGVVGDDDWASFVDQLRSS